MLIAVIVLLFMGQCRDNATPVLVGDTIRERIEHRDTLLIRRDTVIYATNTVRELTREYRLVTDTLTKIVLCDSIVVACDSLAVQYRRQDSIFREQIVDYKLLVAVQDTAIKSQESEIKKLRRRSRMLGVALAVVSVVAVVK